MYNINKLIQKVYKSFVPSINEKKRMDRTAEDFISLLRKNASEKSVSVDFRFSGSYAKGTWVRNESDIDILAVFNKESEIKNLDSVIPGNFIETFGTRKYFRGHFRGVEIEVVPVVKFSDKKEVENSIDLSVLHADYINSVLSDEQKKDVIMLKALCKAGNCYGSETYMHGFSGYAIEVMISKFKNIVNLIEQVETWKPGISIGDNKSKSNYPIFLADPTNPSRNICASVSLENLSKFIFLLKLLKTKPSTKLFVKKDLSSEIKLQQKKRGTRLFIFTTKIKEPRDMFLSKYVKSAGKLIDELKRNDINIYSIDFEYHKDNVKMFLQIANFPRTKTRLVYGPNVYVPSNVIVEFIKSHREIYIVEDKLCYDRKYRTNDFNKFILLKIKEYMSQKSVSGN